MLRPTKYLDKIIAIIYVSTEKSLTTNHHMTFEFLLSYYIGIRTLKDLVHEIIFNICIIRIDILHAMEKFPISFVQNVSHAI